MMKTVDNHNFKRESDVNLLIRVHVWFQLSI